MYNNLHCEVEIEIAGRNYLLKPSFAALCEIEKNCARSIVNLLMKFDQRGIFLKEVVNIVRAGMRAAGHRVPRNLVELLHKQGFVEVLPIICEFLKQGLRV